MSTLLEYLSEVEDVVKQWPAWKLESIRNAFQIPKVSQEVKIEKENIDKADCPEK